MSTTQVAFDFDAEVLEELPQEVSLALSTLAEYGDVDERGAVFTRSEVVEFILDLVGYTDDQPLHERRLLEPSFGAGEFLLAAIGRLLASWRKTHRTDNRVDVLRDAIRAVELHADSADETRRLVLHRLEEEGLDTAAATDLAAAWIIEGDFLLTTLPGTFHYVVGNPPYVRQELIPDALLLQYRRRYKTMYDRADVYVPFIEKSLGLLGRSGKLGFICSDRWTKNKYGGPLRKMVSDDYHLEVYVDMVDTQAFCRKVTAYPAIAVIGRGSSGATRIAYRPEITRPGLKSLAKALTGRCTSHSDQVRETEGIAAGAEPWLLDQPDLVPFIRRLEREFPTLEEAGCKVGIGVATGADKAFIGTFDKLDVEPDRKLRLVTTRDIVDGRIEWRGLGVINPFRDSGGLVELSANPKLAKYLAARRGVIANRQCAKRNPARWYRTIDRITPELANVPKLLIPDIKGEATVVYEPGGLYPHHNLYYVTTADWDTVALQAVLLSGIAHLFVSIYSTRMRGGCLRFQAQYLRRIHVPEWKNVLPPMRKELRRAAKALDVKACCKATTVLYKLSSKEAGLLKQQMENS